MDCVRTAIRLGAEKVTLVYRRTEAEMLGRGEERKNAREEGVDFAMLTLPTRIIGENGKVVAVELQKMELGEPDSSGRRSPKPIKGSEYIIPADAVAIAIGYGADPIVPQTTCGLKADRKALVRIDKGVRTPARASSPAATTSTAPTSWSPPSPTVAAPPK